LSQQVDEVIASNAAARFGRFFDARPDPREHVVVLEPHDAARVLEAAAKSYHDHELAARVLFYTEEVETGPDATSPQPRLALGP
jgi:hypothetical protein